MKQFAEPTVDWGKLPKTILFQINGFGLRPSRSPANSLLFAGLLVGRAPAVEHCRKIYCRGSELGEVRPEITGQRPEREAREKT